MRLSIVIKTWMGFFAVFLLILISLGGFLVWYSSDIYLEHQIEDLIIHGRDWAKFATETGDLKKVQDSMSLLGNNMTYQIGVVDPYGRVILSTSETHMKTGSIIQDSLLKEALQGKVVSSTEFEEAEGNMLVVFVPFIQQGRVAGVTIIHSPTSQIEKANYSIQLGIFVGVVFAILVSSMLALFVSRRLSRPLLEMNKIAIAMTEGDFSHQMEILESTDELSNLGKTLNKLSRELKETINTLDHEREQLKNIIQSMSDGVGSFDSQGKVLAINEQALLMVGINEYPAVIEDFGQDTEEAFYKVINENSAVQSTFRQGETFIRIKMSPLHEAGVLRGVVALLQDITKEHQVEQMRREFVAIVSHEIRSPLGLIQGYAEGLRDGLAVDERLRNQYINVILEETQRLTRLVNDLLDLSRLESKQIFGSTHVVNLVEVLNRVVIRFQPVAVESGIALGLNSSHKYLWVMGHEDRFEQVVINLIDNAIRYTPNGGNVELRVQVVKDYIEVSIIDSGIGIATQDLPNVWNRFYKVDKARTRGKGGTGLGLSIVKSIIEAYGGSVNVRSFPGLGSEFSFQVKLITPQL